MNFGSSYLLLVHLNGFEPSAPSVGGSCSIQLSYRCKLSADQQKSAEIYIFVMLILYSYRAKIATDNLKNYDYFA